MQLRMSPGGRTSNSRRRRPELPPSSVTVTMAVMSMEGILGAAWWTKCFRPCSRADSPFPPPMATTRSGDLSSMIERADPAGSALPALLLRIDQGIERRLVGERSEVRVLAGNQAIARLQFN